MSEESAQTANNEQEAQTFSLDYVKELRGEAANYRTQLREVQEQVKAINEAKTAEETAAAEKAGEFEGLYKTAQQKLDEVSGKTQELEEMVKGYQERDQKEFEALLEQVPEKLRGHLDESIPLDKRIALAKDLTSQVADPPAAGLPGEQAATSYEEDIKNAKTSQELTAVLAKHGKT